MSHSVLYCVRLWQVAEPVSSGLCAKLPSGLCCNHSASGRVRHGDVHDSLAAAVWCDQCVCGVPSDVYDDLLVGVHHEADKGSNHSASCGWMLRGRRGRVPRPVVHAVRCGCQIRALPTAAVCQLPSAMRNGCRDHYPSLRARRLLDRGVECVRREHRCGVPSSGLARVHGAMPCAFDDGRRDDDKVGPVRRGADCKAMQPQLFERLFRCVLGFVPAGSAHQSQPGGRVPVQ